MIRREITVNILEGREERPIANLVQVTNGYSSRIYFETDGNKRVNGKSLMGMMTLGLYPGEPVTVVAEGGDEESAIIGIEKYLSGNGK